MTKPRSCSRTRKTLGTFSAASMWLAVGASVLMLWAPSARADKAPDWLRAAAQEKLPEYPKQDEAVAIVLLDEQQIVVSDKGDIEIRTRRAYKILRPEARNKGYGGAVISFNDDTRVS